MLYRNSELLQRVNPAAFLELEKVLYIHEYRKGRFCYKPILLLWLFALQTQRQTLFSGLTIQTYTS